MAKVLKSNRHTNKVIKTSNKPSKGFYTIIDDSMDGYRTLRESVIEEQFTECTEEYYNKFKKEK